MVQARITNSLLLAAWKTLVSRFVKLFYNIRRGHPLAKALSETGVGKICDF